MEFKGTKGKWEIGELKISVWGESRKGCIADCTGIHHQDFYIGFSQEEQKANAQLIASAPEMFEMLNNIYDKELNITQKDRNEIFKLLKKITE